MLPLDVLSIFFFTAITLSLAPGPDNIFVLTQSMLSGKFAGLWVTFGLCTGLMVHTTAVALGVAAIFQSSPLAFNILKLLGAAYLIYLAWQAFTANATELSQGEKSSLNGLRLYLRGIVMNITNPKVAIFFLAFLPQFTHENHGSITLQIMQLGALFMLATLIVFGLIACFAGFFRDRMKKSARIQTILNRFAGTVFSVLALKLLWIER